MFDFLRRKESPTATAVLEPTEPILETSTRVEEEPAVEEQPEVEEARPFGARVGNLTRFGNVWLDLGQVSSIDFDPADGCGSEIGFKSTDEVLHICHEDSAALRSYLESFDSIRQQVDAS